MAGSDFPSLVATGQSTSVVATTTTTTTTAVPLVPARATPKPRAVTADLPGGTPVAEGRYWSHSFGLPPPSSSRHYRRTTTTTTTANALAYRALTLQPSTAAVVADLAWAPLAGRSSSTSMPPTLAVAGGPRVALYGTSVATAFVRALSGRNRSRFPSATGHTAHEEDHAATEAIVAADRQVSTGGALALAVAYRSDGRLLAAATAQGTLHVADTHTRAVLATLHTHHAGKNSHNATAATAMRSVAWCRDGQRLVSGSDDGAVRVWALPGRQASSSSYTPHRTAPTVWRGHGDAVRRVAVWEASIRTQGRFPHDGYVFSASLDGTVRIWKLPNDDNDDGGGGDDYQDSNDDPCLAVLSHGHPVQTLLVLHGSDTAGVPCWVLSAGGTTVKVWNPLTGACVQTLDARHRQTITSLVAIRRLVKNESNNIISSKNDSNTTTSSMDGATYVWTAGLDGLMRVHRWNAHQGQMHYVHGVALGVAVTALATDPTGLRLAIGLVDGRVWVRQRSKPKKHSQTTERRRALPAGTYAFFQRGGSQARPSADDYVVVADEGGGKRRKALKAYDTALKQFRYGDALDEALMTRDPQIVANVLEELGRRRGLTIALSNRDEESLEPVLAFVAKCITRPRFSALLIGIADKLLDIYSPVAGQSEVIDELFTKLKDQVSQECLVHQNLLTLQGQVEGILAAVEDGEYYDDDSA